MSSQEKRVAVSLFSSIIVFWYFITYATGLHTGGALTGPDANYLVGKIAFIMIGIGIVATIIIHIIFTIIYTVAKGEQDEAESEDERDKLIELKAMHIAFVVFSFAFMGLLGFMAFGGMGPYMVILHTIGSLYAASILADCIKLFLYRRGF